LILEVKNVYKHFGGLQALIDVNMAIEEPQLIGLIGPNGAGKTTLTNVMDGMYKPNSGEVWLKGERIDGMKPYQIARRGFGRTFQVTRAFRRMTVMENMLVPAMAVHSGARRHKVEEKAYEILEGLTIDHLARTSLSWTNPLPEYILKCRKRFTITYRKPGPMGRPSF
jgi:branched-chain amino acid transport system ATP-binding protein